MALSSKAAFAARMATLKAEGQPFLASMTCPRCGGALRHNNSLAGSVWLQCLTPQSLPAGSGCGWDTCFPR